LGYDARLRRGFRWWLWRWGGDSYGGTASNVICHVSMLEGTEESDGTTWLEPVTDEEYAAAQAQTTSSAHA
jgi:hypothetical protein